MRFARSLRAIRIACGMQAQDAAALTGISRSHMWRIETLESKASDRVLRVFAEHWGLSVDDIVREPDGITVCRAALRHIIKEHGVRAIRSSLKSRLWEDDEGANAAAVLRRLLDKYGVESVIAALDAARK